MKFIVSLVALVGLAACGSAAGSSSVYNFGDAAAHDATRSDGGTSVLQEDASACGSEAPNRAGCACTAGATVACYTGPSATRGNGPCHDGTQTCEEGTEFTAFGSCTGEALPGEAGDCLPSYDEDASCPADGSVCEVAATLDGLRWELPCTGPLEDGSCATPAAPQVVTARLNGTSGTLYDVTLHFRGIVEQRTYYGFAPGGAVPGEADGGSGPVDFISGGAAPSLNDPFNIYELTISDPAQTYYLNSGTSNLNQVWLLDYLATLPMRAGAQLTLTAKSIDGEQIANATSIVVPSVPPYPSAYNGQFVQMDPVSVAVAE